MSSQTTGTRKEWEEPGEMTIQTISRQRTGGVMKKRGQAEWTADGPSVVQFPKRPHSAFRRCRQCANSVSRSKAGERHQEVLGLSSRLELISTVNCGLKTAGSLGFFCESWRLDYRLPDPTGCRIHLPSHLRSSYARSGKCESRTHCHVHPATRSNADAGWFEGLHCSSMREKC